MASSISVLHCAGFCFDSPSWEGPERWAGQRNQDLWRTFESVLSLCRSEEIDLLLMAGNLFDQEYVRKETVERVAKSFAKLEGTKIFIAPGQKDPLVTTSAYRLALWPNNVHIFLGGTGSVKISALNVTIYGGGWTAYRQDEPFLDEFQITRDGTLQLMLLHTEVASGSNRERLISIRPEQIAASGLNYLALGYQETWSGIQQEGKTIWADCGSPEPRSFQEKGPHGVLLGEIDQDCARFEFRELAQRRYLEKILEIQSDVEGLAEKLMAETSVEDRQQDLFRIRLVGPVREVEAAVPVLQNLLAAKFRFVEVLPFEGELTRFAPAVARPLDSISRKRDGYPTLTQVFVNKMQERLDRAVSVEDLDHWELVQKIGLAALGQGWQDDED